METSNNHDLISLEEFEDKFIGKKGSKKRDEYEAVLAVELLSEAIKQLRKRNNLTQTQLGELINVGKAQISRLESKPDNMTIATLVRLVKAMNGKITFVIKQNEEELEVAV